MLFRSENATSLVNVTLPSNITSIGEYIFKGCSSLESMTLECLVLGEHMLGDSTVTEAEKVSNLTSITLPEGLTTIPAYAFQNSCFKAITIPSSVTSIGISAFEDSIYLGSVLNSNVSQERGQIVINSNIIGERMFAGCVSLTNVTIPSNVVTIGSEAFIDCTQLREDRKSVV